MTNKAYRYLIIVGGFICTYVMIKALFIIQVRYVRTDIIQGVLVGFGLALATTYIVAIAQSKRTNGWTTMYGCGDPHQNMFLRAACALTFPGPINASQEAMYWITSKDGAARALRGTHNYIMRFPKGEMPPNHAFWSLTLGDKNNQFVQNPINRFSISDRSKLVPNLDGSISILIQNTTPKGFESNWLPAPKGNFNLWLRVYLPGEAILSGKYRVPPVLAVK